MRQGARSPGRSLRVLFFPKVALIQSAGVQRILLHKAAHRSGDLIEAGFKPAPLRQKPLARCCRWALVPEPVVCCRAGLRRIIYADARLHSPRLLRQGGFETRPYMSLDPFHNIGPWLLRCIRPLLARLRRADHPTSMAAIRRMSGQLPSGRPPSNSLSYASLPAAHARRGSSVAAFARYTGALKGPAQNASMPAMVASIGTKG